MGCAQVPSKSLLEERAGYTPPMPPDMKIVGNGAKYVPTRVPEKVIVPWLHAKELPSKDYFWGAWISVVVAPEAWEMKAIELPKQRKRKTTNNAKPAVPKKGK